MPGQYGPGALAYSMRRSYGPDGTPSIRFVRGKFAYAASPGRWWSREAITLTARIAPTTLSIIPIGTW